MPSNRHRVPISMRVYLTQSELETDIGNELLQLCLEITRDGKLDLSEIKALRKWLRNHEGNSTVAAIGYLSEIMNRITANNVINRDELTELHLAVERVLPAAVRTAANQARRNREAKKQEIKREQQRVEKEAAKNDRIRKLEEENARKMRIRHKFSKVAGVSYFNNNGTDRQSVLAKCKPGEQLILKHDPANEHSECAIEVRRTTGQQLGFVPEWLAQEIRATTDSGYRVLAVLKEITESDDEDSYLGANFLVLFIQMDVTDEEVTAYANALFEEQD